MISTVFRVRRPTPSQLRLLSPILSNLAFGFVAVFFFVPVLQAGRFLAFPVVLALLSAIGALYRESWHFDRLTGEVVSLTGFIPFQKRRVIRVSEIEAILYEQFKFGVPTEATAAPDLPSTGQRRFLRSQVHARLAVVIREDSENTTLNIKTARGPGCGRLLDLAEILSKFLEVPLDLKA